jgi:release factor glutamine methyltransferase
MTVLELIEYGNKYIPSHQVNLLLSYILDYDNLDLTPHFEDEVSMDLVNEYTEKVEQVVNQIPIQYVIGKVNFYGYEFLVNKSVLIPRFETEELVENTIKYIDKLFPEQNINIIDLGSGSGNIGITLKKKMPSTNVTCVDISVNALNVAKENAKRLGCNVSFIEGDMLDSIDGKFDVIISNPPYIAFDEQIEDIVKNNEPHLALYAQNNGLYFYDKILSTCKKNLNEKFLIAFEIGMSQKEHIISLANKYFDNVHVDCKKDMSSKDRMIFIYN